MNNEKYHKTIHRILSRLKKNKERLIDFKESIVDETIEVNKCHICMYRYGYRWKVIPKGTLKVEIITGDQHERD